MKTHIHKNANTHPQTHKKLARIKKHTNTQTNTHTGTHALTHKSSIVYIQEDRGGGDPLEIRSAEGDP